MAGPAKAPVSTPAPPSLKKSTSGSHSSKNQTSIAGFFQKKPATSSSNGNSKPNCSALPVRSSPSKKTKRFIQGSDQSLTPAPSSDAVEKEEDQKTRPAIANGSFKGNGLPSPLTPAGVTNGDSPANSLAVPIGFYSPSRKVLFLLS